MKPKTNILVVGAGEAGRVIVAEYARRGRGQSIAGFVDDDARKKDAVIEGKRVLGGTERLGALIDKFAIGQILVAMPSAAPDTVNRIVSLSLSADPRINIYIVPRAEKFFDAVPLSPSLSDLPFEELLGREEFSIDIDTIRKGFAGKTILVTGAGGSIGSELCRQLLKFGVAKIVAIGRGEHSIYSLIRSLGEYIDFMEDRPEIVYRIADVKDRVLMRRIFEEHRPDIIFHAAAHKHVPLMEFNEAEALQNNVGGTRNLLELAAGKAETFVLISTDKAVRPANIMGATKRIAELATDYYHKEFGLKTAVVRFGNVIGSRGSVIPLFREQIARGGPVTVTHPEMTRYFMSIPEAALLVINTAVYATGGETFILDMGAPFRLLDIAQQLISLYGYRPGKDISIVYTGLRPGEKLYEELTYDQETLVPTANVKIRMLKNRSGIAGDSIKKFLDEDLPCVASLDATAIRNLIKALVPEYSVSADAGRATAEDNSKYIC